GASPNGGIRRRPLRHPPSFVVNGAVFVGQLNTRLDIDLKLCG
ncbi:MAG: hypothetical protein ACI8PT_000729, partial [Gammaproteobacteria bacterium]